MSGRGDIAFEALMAIVAELRAAALNPVSDLAMTERHALADLAAAVEAETKRRTGVDLGSTQAAARTMAMLAALARALQAKGEDA